jgi:hypothetical protein
VIQVKRLLPFVKIILLTSAAFIFILGISLRVQAFSGIFQLIKAPVGPIPVVSRLASPILPVAHPVIIPVLPARLLFKEAKVSAEVSKLSFLETFSNVQVFVQVRVLANFTGVTVNSTTGAKI